MAKFYAVRKGRQLGIFKTWSECQKQVSGFSGAEYKSFTSKEEAENFVNLGYKKESDKNFSGLIAYVDGSYNVETKKFGSGVVIINGDEIKEHYFSGEDLELAKMRNVAGEIKAAEYAMRYAIDKGFSKIEIYFDYEGIEKWCTGVWKAEKLGTKKYKEFYNSIKEDLKVIFIKVKAHSGDKFNEAADILAKKAAGIVQ